jgi:5'-nucleotidase
VIVTRDVARDPVQTAIIERYRPSYALVAERVVGTIAADLTRIPNFAGESTLGNIIADATLEMARSAAGHADVAFMNPGGIRSDLLHAAGNEGPRPITYAEASSVLPFRNRIVVLTLTGEMIKDVLEQFDNIAPGQDRMLQVSRGFSYAYDRPAPRSRRVDPRSIAIDGRQVMPRQRYRVAVNEFLAAGGDNFSAFTRGTEVTTVSLDLEMLAAYFEKHSPLAPVPTGRIRRLR